MPVRFRPQRLTPEVRDTINATITADLAFSVFKQIADTPGPSQSAPYARGRAIKRILSEHIGQRQGFSLDLDYHGTGTITSATGKKPSAVFIAHSDEISYLLTGEPKDDISPLIPFCSHRAKGEYPAKAFRYDLQKGELYQSSSGALFSRADSNGLIPYYSRTQGEVHVGDRVIFDFPLERDEADLVRGKIDNAAGVAACLVALTALAKVDNQEAVWFAFTDEEEGPPVSNSTFARGARRFTREVSVPADTLFVVVDGHDADPNEQPGRAALFTEKESQCRGNVVPPDIYAEFKHFAGTLRSQGIAIEENSGYVARSDSPAIMERFRNLLLLGYPVRDAHFDSKPPCTSLDAITAVAKTIACMAVALDRMR